MKSGKMKGQIKSNTFNFAGIKHYIVAQLSNGSFKCFKTDTILSVSATRRIVNMLKETA